MYIWNRRRGRDIYTGSAGPALLTNFKDSNLKNFKLGLANTVGGTLTGSHWAFCGNSTVAGWGSRTTGTGASLLADSRRFNSWPRVFENLITVLRGFPTSSSNFWSGSGFTTQAQVETYDPRLTHSGTTNTISSSFLSAGGGAFATTNAIDTMTFTPGAVGYAFPKDSFDKCSVFFVDVGTDIVISGSNGDTFTKTTTGNNQSLQRFDVTFGSVCTSFTMRANGAAGYRIIGAFTTYAGNGAELHFHNMGWGNSLTSQWADVTSPYKPKFAVNSLAPSVVFFGEDINDPNNSVSPATHAANLTTFINNVKSATCDVIMVMDHWTASSDVDGASGHATLANIKACQAASRGVAAALDIPVVDKSVWAVSWANQATQGWNYDVSHFNSSGYVAEAGSAASPMYLMYLLARTAP